jgi:predicted HicB family RNase H-like nuclease
MSLHRRLAETAEREGVRLKQYIVYLLSDATV